MEEGGEIVPPGEMGEGGLSELHGEDDCVPVAHVDWLRSSKDDVDVSSSELVAEVRLPSAS